MWREKLESEARAKIFWGDSTDSVLGLLQSQGIQNQEASALIESFVQERAAAVSSLGRRSILIGIGLLLVPLVAYIVFIVLGFFLVKLFALCCLAGLIGGWKVVRGVIMLVSPRTYPGDLSEVR